MILEIESLKNYFILQIRKPWPRAVSRWFKSTGHWSDKYQIKTMEGSERQNGFL